MVTVLKSVSFEVFSDWISPCYTQGSTKLNYPQVKNSDVFSRVFCICMHINYFHCYLMRDSFLSVHVQNQEQVPQLSEVLLSLCKWAWISCEIERCSCWFCVLQASFSWMGYLSYVARWKDFTA